MECAAFFHAATMIHRKAFALLYVTDFVKEKSPFAQLSDKEQELLTKTIKKSQEIIMNFVPSL